MSNSKAVAQVAAIPPSAGEGAYKTKPSQYFDGARTDFIDDLPDSSDASILEIGCGSGNTGRLAIARQKCSKYYGVELNASVAVVAEASLYEVLCGDVETLDLPWASEQFDALIMSEVLEHLTDPWALMRKLHRHLKPGALVIAGSPNVAHYKVILMLLRGDWQLAERGVMDRTHLRWFTPRTYARLFEETGYEVLSTTCLGQDGLKARIASKLLLGRCDWLWARQIKVKARRR
jgi:2-polyprenyl-3-methyl-5-hydroxy-6-metoxy-1,4-benzoquinol methylase